MYMCFNEFRSHSGNPFSEDFVTVLSDREIIPTS